MALATPQTSYARPDTDAAYHPAGRLISVLCAADEPSCHAQLIAAVLRMARRAASLGETVLLLDATGGALMEQAGIVYSRTLDHFIAGDCRLEDALFVTANEHFSASVISETGLKAALGTMAGLSLAYDWVFCVGPAGLSPIQAQLTAGSDGCLLGYDTRIDGFMRAYWMVDAMRKRRFRWDPLMISLGPVDDAAETAVMLHETVRDHLGAPPAYAGHALDQGLPVAGLQKLERLSLSEISASPAL